jgi:hypothetical protein
MGTLFYWQQGILYRQLDFKGAETPEEKSEQAFNQQTTGAHIRMPLLSIWLKAL